MGTSQPSVWFCWQPPQSPKVYVLMLPAGNTLGQHVGHGLHEVFFCITSQSQHIQDKLPSPFLFRKPQTQSICNSFLNDWWETWELFVSPFSNIKAYSVPPPPSRLLCQQITVETQKNPMMSLKLWFANQL